MAVDAADRGPFPLIVYGLCHNVCHVRDEGVTEFVGEVAGDARAAVFVVDQQERGGVDVLGGFAVAGGVVQEPARLKEGVLDDLRQDVRTRLSGDEMGAACLAVLVLLRQIVADSELVSIPIKVGEVGAAIACCY